MIHIYDFNNSMFILVLHSFSCNPVSDLQHLPQHVFSRDFSTRRLRDFLILYLFTALCIIFNSLFLIYYSLVMYWVIVYHWFHFICKWSHFIWGLEIYKGAVYYCWNKIEWKIKLFIQVNLYCLDISWENHCSNIWFLKTLLVKSLFEKKVETLVCQFSGMWSMLKCCVYVFYNAGIFF